MALEWLDENLRRDKKTVKILVEALLPETEAAGNRDASGWLRFYLGWYFIDSDDFKQGISLMEIAKETFEYSGNNAGTSRCLNALGVCHSLLGVFDLALDYYREAAAQADKAGRTDLAGTAVMNIAECLYELDEPQEALLAVERCRQDYTIAPHNITHLHHTAGLIYRALGKVAEAELELREAIESAGEVLHSALDSQRVLAELLLDAGRLEEAREYVAKGFESTVTSGERLIGARYRLTKARLSIMEMNPAEALREIDATLVTARDLGLKKIEADAEKAAFEAWQLCGDCGKALQSFLRYSALKDILKGEQTSRRILGLHEDRVRREARHFEMLYKQISSIGEIGRRITANLNLDATLESIYEAINGLMDAPTLVIALVNEETNTLDYKLLMIEGVRNEPISVPLEMDSFGGWCVKNASDILIGDVETEYSRYISSIKTMPSTEAMEKSLIFVPLLVGEKVAGILSIQSTKLNAYDKRSVETVKAIGSYVGIAIENSKLFSQIQRLATIDGLTGLLNRRCLTETINEEYLKAKRYQRSTALIMADIDFFKKVNDTHGHDVGDEVLRHISRAFKEKIRSCDYIGRFGGEEFLILLPETGVEGASILAERLRATVESLEIPLANGKFYKVTASFGISVVLPMDTDYDAALKRADTALYNSKKNGRNLVSIET